MFSLPPTNHFAKGSSHSSVVVKGSFQVTVSRAIFAQNASGSAAASSDKDRGAVAWAAKAGSGGKVRPSARRFSISGRWSTLTWLLLPVVGRKGRKRAEWPFYAGPSRGATGAPRGRSDRGQRCGWSSSQRPLTRTRSQLPLNVRGDGAT